jgi:long-chain acyl-CoA synthetase
MKQVDNKLNHLFADAIRKNWTEPAFSDYQGETYNYQDVGNKIKFLHKFFSEAGIRVGEKVALIGSNSSLWGMTYLGILTYGAVVVPILPDFSTPNIHHIINHSDAKLFFISPSIFERVEAGQMGQLLGILNLNTLEILSEKNSKLQHHLDKAKQFCDEHPATPVDMMFKDYDIEKTCMISYTSGTSGFTKGVMLPRRSILSNIIFAQEHMPLKPGDKIVSFLPMAHAFGLLFEFLFPVTSGCHITFLTRVPSPQIVIKAFGEIRPRLILSVPLVIEKIYKKRILPSIEKPVVKTMLKIPVLSGIIENKVAQKLTDTFGQNFLEVVIGGAPLSEDVELFFKKIGFRYTIGYGMTECGPLITYEGWEKARYRSAGKIVDRMQIKITTEKNNKDGIGEILVKGKNLMLGYYKNPEATRDSFTKDGWLKTGDLGYLDSDGYLFIKGRSKNMILGPSGQNIYPEELEAKVSNLPYVQECVVKYHAEKLIAMIYPDREAMENEKLTFENIQLIMDDNMKHLNKELPKYEQISSFELVDEEFLKTPKRNIKRYLYL